MNIYLPEQIKHKDIASEVIRSDYELGMSACKTRIQNIDFADFIYLVDTRLYCNSLLAVAYTQKDRKSFDESYNNLILTGNLIQEKFPSETYFNLNDLSVSIIKNDITNKTKISQFIQNNKHYYHPYFPVYKQGLILAKIIDSKKDEAFQLAHELILDFENKVFKKIYMNEVIPWCNAVIAFLNNQHVQSLEFLSISNTSRIKEINSKLSSSKLGSNKVTFAFDFLDLLTAALLHLIVNSDNSITIDIEKDFPLSNLSWIQ